MGRARTKPDFVKLARDAKPILRERTARADVDRTIPDETIRELQEAGFFRMLQPKRWGGYECNPIEFFDAAIEIAAACPSTAWVLGVVAVHNWQLALFPEQAQRDVWEGENGVDTLIASSYMPVGKVTRVDGGYRLSGKWGFSSGSDHCQWAFLGAHAPKDDGQPQDMFTLLVPRSDYELVDDWFVSGLKGTGSKSVVVDDAFVPEHRIHRMSDAFRLQSPGNELNGSPLYRIPFGQLFTRTVATPAVGMLQGALDAYVRLNKQRKGRADGMKAAGDPFNLETCARATLAIREVRTVLRSDWTEMMAKVAAGERISIEDRVAYRANAGAATDRMVRALDDLFMASGGSAIFLDQDIQRFFQDIHAARAHHANNPLKTQRNHGGLLMGEPTTDFFL
jgi:3-hydroxy-9,10-secoandrosta-1,3,5(10)-triene-9,17-dione monooxygenase